MKIFVLSLSYIKLYRNLAHENQLMLFMRIVNIVVLLVCSFIVTDQMAWGQVYFEINDFDADRDRLQLVGDVKSSADMLELTQDLPNQKGACWYAHNRIDLSKGFETEFTFKIIKKTDQSLHGDGFAFIIQNVGSKAIGQSGAGLGYVGLKDAVALEFDTYNNNEGSKNHVNLSIFSRAKNRFVPLATVHEIPEITDGESHFARVEYKDGFLSFYLDSYLFPILSTKIDLIKEANSLDKLAWMGFTASTSGSSSSHQLLTWNMNEKLAPPDLAIDQIEIVESKNIQVKSQKIEIKIWDDNKIDGDIVSLKYKDDWIVTDLKLEREPKIINLSLTGFSAQLILYANNVGLLPPNTAALSINDGITTQKVVLNADMSKSESLIIQYSP